MGDTDYSRVQKKILKKMKELEYCGELRIRVDDKLESANGYVIENCGRYLIIIKDGLSNKKTKEILLHEGAHIYLNHLENINKNRAESEVSTILKKIY